jgi:hypothetical protein
MAEASQPIGPEPVEEKEFPKLSPADFRKYNKLAVMMDSYVRTDLV